MAFAAPTGIARLYQASVRAGVCLIALQTTAGALPEVQVTVVSESDVGDALESYGRGERERALEVLASGPDFAAAVQRFRDAGQMWIDAGSTAERGRRLATVATVVVDLLDRTVDGQYGRVGQSEAARFLVEWMCVQLRSGSPSEFERLFHLATVAVLQAVGDNELLVATRFTHGGFTEPVAHIRHGASRFPGEGRFKLAWITVRLETQQISSWAIAPGYLLNRAAGRFVAESRDTSRQLDETLSRLGLLVDDPDVGDEARLRRAVLLAALDRIDDASADLTHAVRSSDPFVRYLSHMMLGALADRREQLSEAVAHYAAAAEVMPAPSALIAQAAVLFRQGLETDAAARIDTWASTSRTDDPWQMYGLRDYRLLPEYLRCMRAMIRP